MAKAAGTVQEVDKRPAYRKPVAAPVILGFLFLDYEFFHILHHLFGKWGILIGLVLAVAAVIWGGYRIRQLFRRWTHRGDGPMD